MILKAPKAKKPKKPTQHQMKAIEKIQSSDPPVVVASIKEKGIHFSIGNGDGITKKMVISLRGRGLLISNRDSLDALTPQSYRLNLQALQQTQEGSDHDA